MDRIYVDFHSTQFDDLERVHINTGVDPGRLPELTQGKRVVFFDEGMEVAGVVEYDSENNFWLGKLDWSTRRDLMLPLFIATERFEPSNREKWRGYAEWAKIPQLTEIVSLDAALCPRLVKTLEGEDWQHIVCEDFRLDYFCDLEYLKRRVDGISCRNILGVYRNPGAHITTPPPSGDFRFIGYDLIEETTQISALTNCGGFPEAFRAEDLNQYGLIEGFGRACEVRQLLAQQYPQEPHAKCEMYAIWRLNEGEPEG